MDHNMLNVVDKKGNWVPGNRSDPFLTFNFAVEIDGVTVAGFTEVSGLNVETQVDRKNFGGDNHTDYSFLAQTKYSDITMKRGIANSDFFWNWYENIINGLIVRKHGSICLLDYMGNPAIWWDFQDACPVKWEGPAFNASNNTIAIETITLNHKGLKMHR